MEVRMLEARLRDYRQAAPDRESMMDFIEEHECLLADGYDEAIIGVADLSFRGANKPVVMYDRTKVIDILAKDMDSREEAEEYFEFNVQGSYVGEDTPVFVNLFT